MAASTGASKKLLTKWIVSLLIPILVYFLLPVDGKTVTQPMAMFLAVTVWAVCLWATEAMNDVAVALILPVLYVALCGVKQGVVYSPWLSEIPLIAIGGFALGKMMMDTGLGRRIGLSCVRIMGGSYVGTLIGFTIAMMIVSAMVPSVIGKAAIFCAISIPLCDALDYKPKSREATAIVLTCFLAEAGSNLCYMTGASTTVLGLGIIGKATGIHTTWLEYAMHNFLPGLFYTAMSLALVILILPTKVNRQALRAVVHAKYEELGPVTPDQKKTAILLIATIIMLVTDKFHGIGAGLVMIGVTFVAFLPGIKLMDGPKFAKINFAPLFFVMGCMTIGSAGGALKVTGWLAGLALPYFQNLGESTIGLASYALGVVVNFLLTPLAGIGSMTAPLSEFALQLNMDPRILFYPFMFGMDNYIFPYEFAVLLFFFSTGYIHFGDMVKVLAARMVLAAAFVVFIGIPYWKFVI